MIRLAVCDDDKKFLERLVSLLSHTSLKMNQEVNIVTFNNGRDLISAVEKQKQLFDVIFLDVDMPQPNGFQTAKKLNRFNDSFLLVFITNMEQQVREGYKYEAFRYLYKSNLQAELQEALSAISVRLKDNMDDNSLITLKYRNGNLFENLQLYKKDILYLRMEKNRRVYLKTIHSEYDLLVKPLADYQKHFDSFVSITRNYLINFNHIIGIENDFFVLSNYEKISLGLSSRTQNSSKEKYLEFLKRRL